MKHLQKGSTLFLKSAIVLIGAVVLTICLFAIPPAVISGQAGVFGPFLLALYIPAIPFFYALYLAIKLLKNIDDNLAFSQSSVKALEKIQYCAIIITVLFIVSLPFVYETTRNMDLPGVSGVPLTVTFASIVIATFAAVLKRLVQNAVEMKEENDLTV